MYAVIFIVTSVANKIFVIIGTYTLKNLGA